LADGYGTDPERVGTRSGELEFSIPAKSGGEFRDSQLTQD